MGTVSPYDHLADHPPEPPSFANDSPSWTDWGFPTQRTTTCPRCGERVPRLNAEGTDTRPCNHPDPAAPTLLCPGSPRAPGRVEVMCQTNGCGQDVGVVPSGRGYVTAEHTVRYTDRVCPGSGSPARVAGRW